jgi:hypothetical protein
MQALEAHVRSGHIVVDEPTDLREGLELKLVVVFITPSKPNPN